jgi:predicted AlkP superfamily phosphohydrolase/phosphomutase
MSTTCRWWKDEWFVVVLVGIILGFIAGIFYPQWSLWLKRGKTPGIKQEASLPEVKSLTPAQILASAGNNHQKVCIIGLDGATWNVMMPLINAGKLPNIAALMQNGTYGNLKSMQIPLSPIIWTSIATGKVQEKHGIEGFIAKLPDEYDVIPVTSDLRRTKAIWNILSEYKKTVGVISWWVTRPPEDVTGFMVSDGFRMHRFSSPSTITEKYEATFKNSDQWALQALKEYTPVSYDSSFMAHYAMNSPEFIRNFALHETLKFLQKDYYTMTAIKALYPKYSPDFFGCYFTSIDCVSHLTWRYYEPYSMNEIYHTPAQDQQTMGSVIPRTYMKMDQYIGEIVKLLPKETIVMVVSDHGFEARSSESVAKWTDLNKLINMLGYLSYRPGSTDFDWSKTKVYEIQDLFRPKRVLYINLKGREPQGLVEKNQLAALRKEVQSRLMAIKTKSGKQLFLSVTINDKQATLTDTKTKKMLEDNYFQWNAYTGDLFAEMNKELGPDEVLIIDGKEVPINLILAPNPQSGDHKQNGIMIMAGGPIKKKNIVHDAEYLDITPTALYLMGLPVAADMDGKVLNSAIEETYLKEHPILRINTYETGEKKQKKVFRNKEEEMDMKRDLKALNYL